MKGLFIKELAVYVPTGVVRNRILVFAAGQWNLRDERAVHVGTESLALGAPGW